LNPKLRQHACHDCNTAKGDQLPEGLPLYGSLARKPHTWSRRCDHSTVLTCEVLDPVGAVDIARRLGIPADTVHVWTKRGVMPEPRFYLKLGPLWDWNTDVVPWLQSPTATPASRLVGPPKIS
jgi:hypothetical protein